jgi:hypothetical protein
MTERGPLFLVQTDMGHACTPDDFPRSPEPNGEHPVTAVLAVVAILLAILLIAWARVEVHGTDDLATLVDEEPPYSVMPQHSTMSNAGAAENEAAASRWATGFSH